MPVIIHHRICGGATSQQKGRASEFRTYVNDWDIPRNHFDTGAMKYELNAIVHSGDKDPYQFLGKPMPNRYADDPAPPHTAFWGRKNKFDQRAEDVLGDALDKQTEFIRLTDPVQLAKNEARRVAIPAAAQSLKDKNAAKRAKAEADLAKAKAEEEEARRIAYEASEEGQRAKQKEAEEAERAKQKEAEEEEERERKKQQKKQREAAEKEERRIKREADEEAAREAKKQKEADEKAAKKAKVEAEQKAAADKKAAKEAEQKAKAEAEKAKPKAAAAATPQPAKKKNKGATAAAAGGDDLDDFLEQEIKRAAEEAKEKAIRDKQIEEQKKKSETEAFAAKARRGTELARETDENSEISCGVIGLVKYLGINREAPDFATDRMKLKKVLGRGYELITDIGIAKLLALVYCVYKTLVEMQHTVVGTRPNGDKIYMNQETLVGNWWNVFSELQFKNLKGNGWTQSEIETLPTDMPVMFDRWIIPAVWSLAREGQLIDGTNTPNVRVYPYKF